MKDWKLKYPVGELVLPNHAFKKWAKKNRPKSNPDKLKGIITEYKSYRSRSKIKQYYTVKWYEGNSQEDQDDEMFGRFGDAYFESFLKIDRESKKANLVKDNIVFIIKL